jgi:hypothetical protein
MIFSAAAEKNEETQDSGDSYPLPRLEESELQPSYIIVGVILKKMAPQ